MEVVPAGRCNAAAQLASSCGADVLKHSQAGSSGRGVRTLAVQLFVPITPYIYSVHSRSDNHIMNSHGFADIVNMYITKRRHASFDEPVAERWQHFD